MLISLDIESITSSITAVSEEFKRLNDLSSDVSALQSSISGINTNISSLQSNINSVSASIISVESTLPQIYLHTNGVTLVARPSAVVGQSYSYNGTSYLIVDDSTIAANKTLNIVTTRVTDMTDLFKSTSFNSDIGHWDTSSVTVSHGMFEGNTSFNQDISSWNTAALVDSSYMFSGATAFNQNYTSSWNTSAVTDNSYMFTLQLSHRQMLL